MIRTFLFFLVSVLFSTPLVSQQYNQVDASGMKQGKWLKTHDNGNTRYEGQFRNDRPYGTFTYYYKTGKLEAKTTFSDDGIIARTKTYFPNGRLRAEGKYINQQRDSTWRFYSEMDGSLVAKEQYSHGKLNGKSIVYFAENGEPAEITNYKDGVKSGKQQKFYTDGKLMSESYFKDDKLSGEFKSYYANGKVRIYGMYKNGMQSGRWTYYDEDGKEMSEEQFKQQEVVKETGD